jgi:endonuclease YncB( thermonuclease family)
MTDGNNEKPQTDAQASRQLGKLAALVLLVIVALLIERYCSHKPPPFGPGVKIVSIDGDTLRAGDGSKYRIFGIDAPELHQTCKRPTASPGPAAARPRRGSPH